MDRVSALLRRCAAPCRARVAGGLGFAAPPAAAGALTRCRLCGCPCNLSAEELWHHALYVPPPVRQVPAQVRAAALQCRRGAHWRHWQARRRHGCAGHATASAAHAAARACSAVAGGGVHAFADVWRLPAPILHLQAEECPERPDWPRRRGAPFPRRHGQAVCECSRPGELLALRPRAATSCVDAAAAAGAAPGNGRSPGASL